MDRFIDRQNVERYRRLRETMNADKRQQIVKLLAEKMARFKLEFRRVDLARGSKEECRPR
jgi:hypothetical protein